MLKKLSLLKTFLIVFACGGVPLVTNVSCDPYYGFSFFRDDDSDYYYDDGYYYDDSYYYEPYCDPWYCY